jgi:hypothetical protein
MATPEEAGAASVTRAHRRCFGLSRLSLRSATTLRVVPDLCVALSSAQAILIIASDACSSNLPCGLASQSTAETSLLQLAITLGEALKDEQPIFEE